MAICFWLPVINAINFRNKLMAITLKHARYFSIYNAHKLNFSWALKYLNLFSMAMSFSMVFSWPLLWVHFSMDTDVMLRKCGVPSGAIVNAHRACIEK